MAVKSDEQAIKIIHVTIRSPKSFDDVKAALATILPKLSIEIQTMLAKGDAMALKEKLEEGPELSVFLSRDHGDLLKIYGLRKSALQFEIGNPLTASKMTRHRLEAGLYAPLRIILFEDQSGDSVFEYDKPSSLFGQFGNDQVTAVAQSLDAALEKALRCALE